MIFSPKTLTLVKEDDWSIGPSFFSTLTPNIMHLFSPLSTFMHFFVEAFLFPLKDDSFHLLPLFSFTAKEKLSLEGSRI